ncbi:hypothetical protein CDD81_4009 [Ophiocordyceps australis]|uniref:FAD-binding FR-type domain-containing protein n=1 Tax=Ophiocordyceps australis TaxID=1399860 RepID=A0A2C5Y7R5_9HYPO|nr:hypothetical protein CDD81_4009 [Ophiocordyceps australis]
MPSKLLTFHPGETAIRQILKAPATENPTNIGLPAAHAARIAASPLVAVGTLDGRGRPWTTIWGGRRGFAGPLGEDVIGFGGEVDEKHDPVFAALRGEEDEVEEDVKEEDEEEENEKEDNEYQELKSKHEADGQPLLVEGKMMSALAIDLETRDRIKLAGRLVPGSAPTNAGSGALRAAMEVTECLGNCPKYLNTKHVLEHSPAAARLVSSGDGRGLALSTEALALLAKADMFFLSSTDGKTMDTNHRGGPAGFVRVVSNDAGTGGVVLAYPEYSGNRLYQSLGNLRINHRIGIVVPDYHSSDVLYLTGTASILVGAKASALLAQTALAVRIHVTAARFVRAGLPFYGDPGEPSPYTPPIRLLRAERGDEAGAENDSSAGAVARLIHREVITPTIANFTFRLSSSTQLPTWHAGQHVTLNFAPELDKGYAHMRDDDPQSLNDDFIRTFTVTNEADTGAERLMRLTLRRHGPATGLLWDYDLDRPTPLNLPVLGFGGKAEFRLPITPFTSPGEPHMRSVFIAGGVGVTPLLAQARAVLEASRDATDLTVLWSLRSEDADLAVHVFGAIPALAPVTSLFITSGLDDAHAATLKEAGAVVATRRLEAADVWRVGAGEQGGKCKFFLCAGPGLLNRLREWLEGEEVVWEDFGY